jgi:hypothetical protein
LLSPGCQLAALTAENLAATLCSCTDKAVDCTGELCLADRAWKEVRKSNPETAYSIYYARGFRDGYMDYLNEGGDGEPPPVPPPCYWSSLYHSPAGHQAVEDWFAGFRHGAALAKASGYRANIVVAVSDLGPGANAGPAAPPDAFAAEPGPAGVEPAPAEVLPPPRPLAP